MILKKINIVDCEFILDKSIYNVYITDFHTDILYFSDCVVTYDNINKSYYAEIYNMSYPYDLLIDFGLYVNIASKSGLYVNIDYLYFYVENVIKFKRKLVINSLY